MVNGEKTIREIWNAFDEEQKLTVNFIVGYIIKHPNLSIKSVEDIM